MGVWVHCDNPDCSVRMCDDRDERPTSSRPGIRMAFHDDTAEKVKDFCSFRCAAQFAALIAESGESYWKWAEQFVFASRTGPVVG